MLAQPHRHQPRIVGNLEAFDLQVMLGMAEAEVARLIGEAHVLGDLVEHALVELGLAASHAGLELGAPAHRAVHERAEAHGSSPSSSCRTAGLQARLFIVHTTL
jgi:hypothetical protein